MLDALDFAHHPFERIGGKGGHLFGRSARELEEHIDHRHVDLRIFLPGRVDEPDDPEHQASDQEKKRQR